ncbi:MAG: tetratricopeptide repeat protein, partial [Treponema socranskii subsp. buccale]
MPKKRMLKKVSYAAGIAVLFVCIFAFPSSVATAESKRKEQAQLVSLLKKSDLAAGSRYAIVNQIANNMLSANEYQSAVLFLTDWVQKHPDDAYNSYWLLMTGYAYLSMQAEPFAEY